MSVDLDDETFAVLVGRQDPDVYLFRVSDAWLDAMGDEEWHGPVEWRVVRGEGRIVELQMRAVAEPQQQHRAEIAEISLEDLRAENQRYEKALERIAEASADNNHSQHCHDHRKIARRALAGDAE